MNATAQADSPKLQKDEYVAQMAKIGTALGGIDLPQNRSELARTLAEYGKECRLDDQAAQTLPLIIRGPFGWRSRPRLRAVADSGDRPVAFVGSSDGQASVSHAARSAGGQTGGLDCYENSRLVHERCRVTSA